VTELEPLSGSEVPARPADELVGPADPHDRLVVSVYLKMPESAAAGPPRVAPAVADWVAAVTDWARSQNLEVVDVDPTAGRTRLAGTVADLQRAFGIELLHYRTNGHDYLSYQGQLHLPADLHPHVQAVLGLDNRPIGRPS
jgi:kumamolisin